MSTVKPIIVLVPGAWHTPEYFGPLISLLSLAGYPCIPISLPSAGAHPAHQSFSEDVAAIRKQITLLVEGGREVVIVMHSGGSVPTTEALRDLSKNEREEQGNKGGVTCLVYIGILLPKAGTSLFETFNSVMQSPDLDPDFVRETNQDYHVVAAVCPPNRTR
jgi:pimeloyl-ACP methyl ester carboxylesterase